MGLRAHTVANNLLKLVTQTTTKSDTTPLMYSPVEGHSFGYWLRLRRKALDLTQKGLADRVGCSVALIRKIEAEERRPSAQITERLAEVLNISEQERAAFLRFARGDWHSAPAAIKEEVPSDVPAKASRSNLPATTTSLISRQKEIALLHGYLRNNEIRLVTLIGPPGIGKTRLSIETARTSLPYFQSGIFFVALAPLEKSTLIAMTIAQTLGFIQAKNVSPEDLLKEGIGEKEMLLVLDNCEHLIEGVASIAADLLAACPRLKILATSRESLRIPGEWLYTVPAFDLPIEPTSVDLERAPQYPALMLFAERARASRADFALTAENIGIISAICARLDGLPLVIELMAARMRVMSPQALLDRLTGQFVLTAGGMRAVTARQQTLQNAINGSYSLLSAEEQELFLRLSVFSGGFTLATAEAIFSRTVTNKSVSDLITLLLDKSLLQRTLNEHGEPRFSLLVTIQKFASNHLRERNAETEVRNWHQTYFLDLAEQSDKEIHGPAQVEWIDRLEVERDNFRAALDWSISNQQTDVALRLLNALCWLWLMRTHFSETRNWFEKVRSLPEISSYPALYARLLNFMGRMNWVLGNYREAQSFLTESQAIWLRLGSAGEQGLAEALSYLGMVALSGKESLKAAQSFFEQSFELYEKHADQWGMAFALIHLGRLATMQNKDAFSFALLEKSMTLFEHFGDIWGKSRVSHLLGELFLRQENYEKARFYFEQNLKFDEEIKFKPGVLVALGNLGDLHRHQQEYVQARQYYEKSLDMSRAHGMKEDWGLSWFLLGLLALHQNNYSVARQYFVDYIKAERESLNKLNAYVFVLSQAAISAGSNQPERAARLSGAAQGISETLDYQISRFNQAEFDRHIQIAREQLGETRFQELQAVGRAMTMEQVIAYALEDQE